MRAFFISLGLFTLLTDKTSVTCRQLQRLFQLFVFCLGLLQDGDVAIGVFTQNKEIMVGAAGLGDVVLERMSGSEADASKHSQREIEHDAG